MTADAFIVELKKIIASQPRRPILMNSSENCESSNYIYISKNLYSCFDCARCTDSFYLFDCFNCANCGDCDYAGESELCYETVDCVDCFNTDFSDYCHSTRDTSFSYNCRNCHDIFGCVNLQNKSFCIFNRQLTEQEFREQVKKYKTWPPEKIYQILEDLKKKFPLTQTIGSNNQNTDFGNYLHNDKNCYLCFDAAYDEDCAYLFDSFHNKGSVDMTYASQENNFCYEIADCGWLNNCDYCAGDCGHSQDSAYLFNCGNVKNCLGCVGLKNKQYCILNRQFTPEEYKQISDQILADLRAKNIGWADLEY